ncbi:MAG: hypothetical protein NTW79_03310 [Candidatus Berkelbacteria bacterium]|nr:hypothetical protein [Candidatus Berkelbacteria bacterium]
MLDFKVACLRTFQNTKDWKASAWWLERKYPDEFSTKRVLDVNFEPAQTKELSPEQKEKLDEIFQRTKQVKECENCEYASNLQN